jgi:hypothetical protein
LKGKTVIAFLMLVIAAMQTYAQVADTAAIATTDTSVVLATQPDSNTLRAGLYHSPLLDMGKAEVFDVQQYRHTSRNMLIFILLMVMLGALTYLKTAFNKDIEELLQSVYNQNIAQQIFRTRSREISFSSVVLTLNFVVVMSLYVRFILLQYFHVTTLEQNGSTLLIIFLFTFFYLGKILALKFIGLMFDANDACEEYIYNFSLVCKTLGLALLPALFIFYTAPENFFNIIFIVTIFISTMMLLLFAWRGLSTGYKLMYRSVYHFFIYVCVVEISPIFLLFKLLTKTII